MDYEEPVQSEEPGPFKLDVPPAPQEEQDSSQAFVPFAAPATKLLIAANVVIFLIMLVASGFESLSEPSMKLLVDFGADYGPLTLTGDYWRVFTNMFVHIGIVHIAMNMYALWIIGNQVEELYGSSKFVFLYIVAGIGGALTSLLWNPQIVSAGASGAIFGAYGSLLSFAKVNAKHYREGVVASVTRTVLMLLVYNLIFGFAVRGIDNACHIGGFITGVIAGFFLAPSHPSIKTWSAKDCVKAVGLILALCAGFIADKMAFNP